MRARAFRRRHAAGGMTLVEILIALAVAGILAAGGVVALGRLGRNQAYQGYVSGFGQAVSDATTRANQTNTIYALTFDGSGYSWGPVGGTLSSCTGAASAPTLTSTIASHAAPNTVTTGDSGWLCFSAPGLVYRLANLSATCSYKTYTFPCLNFSGPGKSEKIFISVGGQVIVQ